MKIALLLPGMLRNFEVSYPRLKKYIIDKFDCDIFFSGYPNKRGLEYCENKMVELYQPKKYIIREYTDELRKEICPNEAKYNSNKRPESFVHTWMSGIWNVKIANELRKQYESENNFKYDLVFKIRHDWFFFSQPSVDDLNLALTGKLLIPPAWDFKSVHPSAVSDAMAISKPEVMDIYCNLYDSIDTYYNNGTQFHPETLCGVHIETNKLERVEARGHEPNPYVEMFGMPELCRWDMAWAMTEDPDFNYPDNCSPQDRLRIYSEQGRHSF